MTLRVVRMVEERFHRDEEDRPIREGRTPHEYLREGDIEYRTCPYPGSRFQHKNPMNVSALRQASAHWDEVLDALASLRTMHDQTLGITVPGIWDIWRTSQLGSALPWFYLFRDQAVPGYAAALSKMTLGMGIWAQRMFVKSLTERWSAPALTAETILQLAEDSGTLVGETEVCSGSEKMLLKYFDVHVTSSPAAGALPVSRDDFLRFAAHYTGFKLVIWIYYLARRFLYADVVAAQGSSPELAELRDTGVEPSDFFIIEPGDLARVIPQQREGWFRSLADLLVPISPDRSDLALRDHAFAMAGAMGKGESPGTTWAALDEGFGRVVAAVEAGFCGGCPDDIEVPADVRDRLIGASPRNFFTSFPNAAGA
ncbi:MAG TPA: hypothetical protein VLB44_06955 [Kofleriaceae bacterium]|nr:hypothetical protein [Kofleriaceae bacterium]